MGLKQKARLDMSAKGLKVARIATARVQSKFESFFIWRSAFLKKHIL